MFPHVTIIILNWNGWKDTIECLESLYQITYPNYTVVVVDNASKDVSIEKIREYCEGKIKVESKFFKNDGSNKPIKIIEYTREESSNDGKEFELENIDSNKKLILIRNEKNHGYAEGNNIGIKYVLKKFNPNYILLLNNDTVVDKNFIEELVRTGDDNDSVGLLNPIIFEYKNPSRIQFSGEKISYFTGRMVRIKEAYSNNTEVIYSDIASGACLLIKKVTIDKIGLLPTEYHLQWEDIDYSLNAQKNKLKCVCIKKSKIWHKHFSSIGEVSDTRIYYSIRNRFIFRYKYFNYLQFFCSTLFFIFVFGPLDLINFLIKSQDFKKIKIFYNGIKDGLIYIINKNNDNH